VALIGDPAADLRSNIAAESRAKIVYERLINLTDDPGVKEALGFLMTREISHQQSFEKALYSITPNFPAGKLGGMPEFTNVYFKTSVGDGVATGPWNSAPTFEVREGSPAVDGGDGLFTVNLSGAELDAVEDASVRTHSMPDGEPLTGAMLGMEGAVTIDVADATEITAEPKAAMVNAEAKAV